MLLNGGPQLVRRSDLAILVHKQWMIVAPISCCQHKVVQHAHGVDHAGSRHRRSNQHPRVVHVQHVALTLPQDNARKLQPWIEGDILSAQTPRPDNSDAVT
jgi:hypothetical protein